MLNILLQLSIIFLVQIYKKRKFAISKKFNVYDHLSRDVLDYIYTFQRPSLYIFFKENRSVLQIAVAKSTHIHAKCYIAKGTFVQFKAKSCIT